MRRAPALYLSFAFWCSGCLAPGTYQEAETTTEADGGDDNCGCDEGQEPDFDYDSFFDIANNGGDGLDPEDEPMTFRHRGGAWPDVDDWQLNLQSFGLQDPAKPKPSDPAYKSAKNIADAGGGTSEQLIPAFATAKDINALRKDIVFPLKDNNKVCDGTGPCIELHNHFQGVPSLTQIMKMAEDRQAQQHKKRTYTDPLIFLNDVVICKFFENRKIDKKKGSEYGITEFQKPAPNVYAMLDPMIDRSTPKKPKLKDSVTKDQATKMLEMVFNATNRTPFNDAYPARGGMVEAMPPLVQWEPWATTILNDLKDDNLIYTEQSFGIGKLSDPMAMPVTMIKKLRASVGTNVATPAKLPQDIRFLPMLNTALLADAGKVVGTDRQEQLGGAMGNTSGAILLRPDVGGIDIAGPEADPLVNFDAFKGIYVMLSRAARTRHRPLFFRPHAGEGSFLKMKAADCAADGKWDVWCPKRKDAQIDFQDMASKNITSILTWIAQLTKDAVWAGDWVPFRLGHVTQLTEDQAKQMAAFNKGRPRPLIWAEVNPIGNLVTGALQPDCPDLRGVPPADGNQAGLPAATIIDDKHKMYERFPLLLLLYYDVPTILGTDAQSVMHTTMADQYQRAQQIIDWYKAGNITLKIDGKALVYAKADKPTKMMLDQKLDVQRLRDWAFDYWQSIRENDTADTQKPQSN